MAERVGVETELNPSRSRSDQMRVAEEDARLASDANGEGRRPSFHRSSRARWMALGAVLALVAASVLLWRHYAGWESTDDAQIDGHINPVSARVAGQVVSVKVQENQRVEAGAVLVELDPRDFRVAVDRAKAEYADALANAEAARAGVPITSVSTASQVTTAKAAVENARTAVSVSEKQAQAAEAKVEEAEANSAKAQADLNRYKQLVAKEEISGQQYDQAVAAARANAATLSANRASAAAAAQQVAEARGRLAQAEAELRSAQTAPQQVTATRARASAAEASVQTAKAALEQAELNLQYTTIVAPVSGLVGKKTVEVGQNVQAGQALMAIVPLDDIWVTANFKETQLRNMRPGQRVKVHVDAYGRDYDGYVESLAGASGADFSLLPPENATGNYVKVVQRVPVRIRFDKGQDPGHMLRLGMSVEPKVKTN
jgi:membrane fusion protein, multidrug efflux system